MDVCCVNRPFDDWTQPRICLEAEAILEIMGRCLANQWQLMSSTALESEIAKTPDLLKQQRVMNSFANPVQWLMEIFQAEGEPE